MAGGRDAGFTRAGVRFGGDSFGRVRWLLPRLLLVLAALVVFGSLGAGVVRATPAAPSFVSASSVAQAGWPTTGNYTNSVSVGIPSGVQSGDVMVAQMYTYGINGLTAPAGWRLVVQRTNDASGEQLSVFLRVAGGSEPSTYSFSGSSFSISSQLIGAISDFRGVDPTYPVDNASIYETGPSASTTSAPSGQLPVTVDNAMIFSGVYFFSYSSSASTPPSGTTQDYHGYWSAPEAHLAGGHDVQTSAGLAQRTYTVPTALHTLVALVALTPAGATQVPYSSPVQTGSAAGYSTTTTVQMRPPVTVEPGDVLVAVCYSAAGRSMSAPTGWSMLDQGAHTYVMVRTADYTDPTDGIYSFTSSGGWDYLSGVLAVYTNAGLPVDGHVITAPAGSTSTPTAASLTPSGPGRTVISWVREEYASINSPPSGMTLAQSVFNNGDNTTLGLADLTQTTAAAVAASWTLSAAESGTGVGTLALQPRPVPLGQTFGSTGVPGDDPLAVNPSGSSGEPVNTATGSFYTSAVDVALPGIGVPFTFTRSYNSADATSGTLGPGWTDSLAWSLTTDGDGNATVRSGTGQQLQFFVQPDGSFLAAAGGQATLSTISGGYKLITADQDSYTFNSSGLLTAESDRNGQGITLSYTSGVLSSVTDSVGRTITFTTTSGHLTGISLPDGRSVAYGYTSGKLTSFTDLNGHTVSYGYDTNGLLNQITDQNGNTVVANVYDSATGRVTEQTDGRGHHSYFSWDPATQTSTYTDARGKTWTQVYAGNVLQSDTDPDSDTTSYGYDANLNRTTITNPRNNTTTFTYDTNGNLLTETAPSPLNYVQSWTYNSKNDPTSYTNGNSQTTTYGYNTAGDLTTVTGPDPDGAGPETAPVTTYGRDATTGQVTSVTDPRGKETDYGYDADGNLTSVTTPEGEETTYGYDSGGRMTSKVEARGNVSGCSCASSYTWAYTYDDANHMLTQTDPLSHETQWTYYPGGQLETVTDANSHTTTYTYDDDNNLSTVTAPDSTVTTYTYDDNNNELTKEDANSHTTTYTYDDANRLASKELPGGQTWNYSYDNDGNLATMVDANGNATMTSGDGTTTYGYDELDRLTSVSYSDAGISDVTYTYDGDGNRTQMTDGGTVSYSYDNLDRLTGVTRSSHTFSYGYDANSNLTSETYPDSFAVTYAYTDDEQLHTAVSNSQTTTYSYDPAGNLTATALPTGNGYTETDTYDHAGRLTEVDNHNGGTVLSDFAYTLDPVGNPTKTIRTGDISSTTTYGYDNLDRITSQCLQLSCPLSTDPKTSWTYDNVGNRLTQTTTGGTVTSTFNSDDRLTAAGSTSYSYDANGNQTAAGSNTYTYDQANRLASATIGATTTDYSYDGDGNRLSSNDGTNTTNYSWDPAAATPQLDTETNGSGTTIRDYLYGNNLISMTTGGGTPATYYYSHDAQGSTADLTNSSGTTQITYSYDAWGNPTATPISGAPTNPIQYTAAYNDPTGLTHLGAREYDPTTGRFLQTDPLDAATGSAYAYTDDRPTAEIDPRGLCAGGFLPSSACSAAGFALNVVEHHYGEIATGLAIAACATITTPAGCALVVSLAYVARASQRANSEGFRASLKMNLLDAGISYFTFGGVAAPGLVALSMNGAGDAGGALVAKAALAGPDVAFLGVDLITGSANCSP